MAKNGTKWSKMVQNAPKQPNIVQIDPTEPKIVLNGLHLSDIDQYGLSGPTRSKMVQNVPNISK